MEFKYYSVKEIQNFIETNNLSVNKKFGQNFLINSGVADTIAKSLEITGEDIVIEIGCGLGSLTNRLLACNPYKLYGFEIDNAYIIHLQGIFKEFDNFNLVAGDFLKTSASVFEECIKSGRRIVIAGNLPYYITTPIFEKIFTSGINYSKATFMIQREVAGRLTATPGHKEYSSLTVFTQFYNKVSIAAKISPASFYPPPNVDSAVIVFSRHENRIPVKDEELFIKTARSLFISRRKQIKNNFVMSPFLSGYGKDILIEAIANSSIPMTERGENLSLEQIAKLSDELFNLIPQQTINN